MINAKSGETLSTVMWINAMSQTVRSLTLPRPSRNGLTAHRTLDWWHDIELNMKNEQQFTINILTCQWMDISLRTNIANINNAPDN